MYLKQANERCQTSLEKKAEPIAAHAWLQGDTYPVEAFWKSWDYLIQNHPHDSICGCSVDEVHNQMMTRFEWSQEISEELTRRAMNSLTGKINTSALEDKETGVVVFNPSGWDREEVYTTEIILPAAIRTKGIRVFDTAGKEYPAQIINVDKVLNTVINPQIIPFFHPGLKVKIAFNTGIIPACGYKTFRIRFP
jgi:mannosylglycerate hydrolase